PELQSWPNPAQDELTVSYPSRRAQRLELRVFALTGQLVHQQEQLLVPGPNQFTLRTAGLSSGVYLLQSSDGERVQVQRIGVAR
ncbi:MAG TPA: T9SS type A sorting domain-containing protein, partial [Hymenobacter sp.]